jgi:hypothetical protein
MSDINNTNNTSLTDEQILKRLDKLINTINSTKGTNAKIEIFSQFTDIEDIVSLLWNPEPTCKTGITVLGMDNFVHNKELKIREYQSGNHKSKEWNLLTTFNALTNKVITGDLARSKVASLMELYKPLGYDNLVKEFMSKKQNTRLGYKSVQKALPNLWKSQLSDLNVSGKQFKDLIELGNPMLYDEIVQHIAKNGGRWYRSLKMDGIHCRVIILEDTIIIKKRSGHLFSTLSLLELDIKKNLIGNLSKVQLAEGVMLCGEIRVNTDGTSDDFTKTASEALKKNVQMSNFSYDIYDFIPLPLFYKGIGDSEDDPTFEQRYELLKKAIPKNTDIMKVTHQEPYAENSLKLALEDTIKNNQEGLMVKRGDSPYKGKRHDGLIKLKNYSVEEYKVVKISTEIMDIKVSKETGASIKHLALKNIMFEISQNKDNKDNKDKHYVHVGSGFTPDQRIDIAANPDKIINLWVSVKHYGISQDKKTNIYSLRMPIYLHTIGAKERDY